MSRQMPVVGSKRDRRMTMVKAYLLAHPSGGTYEGVGRALGLWPEAVQRAVADIRSFDPDLIVAVPTERSGWRVSLMWRDIMNGAVNQARHLKTRLQSEAILLRKIHRSGKFPPHISQMYLAAAMQIDAQVVQQDAIIAMHEAAKPHAQRGNSSP